MKRWFSRSRQPPPDREAAPPFREDGTAETEEAIDELYLAHHADPASLMVRAELCERLHQAGRMAEVEPLLALPPERPGDDAGSLLTMARAFKRFGRFDEAIRCYRRAQECAPTDPLVPAAMGLAHFHNGSFAAADACYGRALALDADCVPALHNLGILRREQGDAAQSEALLRRALDRAPGTLETLNCLAHSLRDLGRTDEALALYEQVLAAAPGHADARLNQATTLLAAGRFAEGWDAYERRLDVAQDDVLRDQRLPRWQGESGAAIHVVGEQGLGDQILFASCLPDLMRDAQRVSLGCDPRLAALFGRAFPALDIVPGGSAGAAPAGAQCCVALGSLPKYFRRAVEDFPDRADYLKPEPVRIARWRERLAGLGPAPKVGLSWAGGSPRTRGPLRSIALERLASVVVAGGAIAVSLQYGDRSAELARARDAAAPVHHWPGIDEPEECAALIAALDAVVTIDNTIAHLAGASGAPTTILLAHVPEWRWGREGARSHWYPAARLLRQEQSADWTAPLRGVAELVAALKPGATG